MNLGSLYIGMGVLLACILPFYIGHLRRKKRQNKEMIDTISATIILQSYLEQKK